MKFNGGSRHIPAPERLMARVLELPNGCWQWTGFIDPQGYGRVGYKGTRSTPVHQAFYDCFVGPIPGGMTLDHLCHTRDENCKGGRDCPHRRCVNPAHLEPVTHVENTRRGRGFGSVNAAKTHCPHGHPYDAENTYTYRRTRYCIACYVRRYGRRPIRSVA